MDYGHVEQTVVDGRARSYIGIVAILRSIAHSHQKRLFSDGAAIGCDGVKLRFIMCISLKRTLEISQHAATLLLGESRTHSRIKSHAECAEKLHAVDRGIVYRMRLMVVYHLHPLAHVDRYAEMPGQTVARPTRYDAESSPRATQRGSRLIDRTVTSGSQHGVIAHVDRFGRQARGVAVTLRIGGLKFPAQRRESVGHIAVKALLAACT